MTTSAAQTRVRPRDRKRHIEDAAALAFAERGYHAVGMQDIAAAVGISAPALYRHFPNKYALFVQTAFTLAHRLVEATEPAASLPPDTDPRAVLDALLDAVITTTIELRATGGIYRWEGRFLEPDDRRRMTGEFATLRERFAAAHRGYRPALAEADRRWVVLAALSTVASITAHRAPLEGRALRTTLKDAAWRALDVDLDGAGEGAQPSEHRGDAVGSTARDVSGSSADRGRRERLIEAAVRLFAARGYTDVTIEDLAAEVDLTPSGVYRHFESKSAVLLAACERAAVSLERSVLDVREDDGPPAVAMTLLCRAYVDHTFANLALMRVYFAELGNLSDPERRRLRSLQRAHVADWTALLLAARPELSDREATVLVHAALGVVSDEAPLLPERDTRASARLVALMAAVLGV